LSEPTDAADGTTDYVGTVRTNKSSGTLYWVVAESSTPPTAAQIKAGEDFSGNPAAASGSQLVVSSGVKNVAGTGLAPDTTYYTHYVHENTAGDSNVASADGFTTEALPMNPVLSAPTDAADGSTACTGTVTTDQGSGTLYWVVSISSTPPSVAQVKAGQSADGSPATASGSQAVSTSGEQNISDGGLSPGTTYYTHYVQNNVNGDSNVASADGFTTNALAVLSSPTATPHALPIFAGTVSTDQGSGTLYWVVTTSATPPSAAQVKAGENHLGAPANSSGNQAVSGTGAQSVSGSSGLVGNTTYYTYYVQNNANGDSNVAASGSWVSFRQETIDLVARMSSTPNTTRQGTINTCIAAIIAAGVWTKLDVIHIYAAHDSQAARLNWKGTSFTAIAVASPTFTVDRGYNGDGAASYVDSGFNPTTGGVNYAQNSAFFAFWSLNNAQNNASWAGWYDGTDGVTVQPRTATDTANCRLNQAATITSFANANSQGFIATCRTASNALRMQRNGVSLSTGTTVSTALNNNNLYVGRSTATGFCAAPFCANIIGGQLTPTEETNLYNAIQAYMTAVGV